MKQDILKDKWVVILCGGKGSRLGSITENLPKPLVKVHNKPILWYTFLTLYKHGFRNFIFPVGYKGQMIEGFITSEFGEYDCDLRFIDTGPDSPIAKRIKMVSKHIVDGSDFFLVNGDTLFDFDLLSMYQLHKRIGASITLSSVEIVSSYGVIVEENGKIIDFSREKKISYFSLDGEKKRSGFVNAGLTWLNKDVLELIDLNTSENFEQDLFPKVIHNGANIAHYKIDGSWFAIDTQKDLKIVHTETNTKQKIGLLMKEAKKDLSSRYSYKTRYYDNANGVMNRIINKTIIPHQVEVQPGPLNGNLCWLRCPYCYGKSSSDTGERLEKKRYVEILKQIAEGGVNKIIFAGYASDPLNYEHIEDLVQVPLDYNQIFGFHTKALKVSNRLVKQITTSDITPLSYFSVSVDAGSNEAYNIVHGMQRSNAKYYSRVLENIKKISSLRKQTGAPLDISATYLINCHNGNKEEVLSAIEDLRNSGVDIVRFTFPQVPRGYNWNNQDKNIPNREQIIEYMDVLRPIIENQSSDSCQVLIMDLDNQYSTYKTNRTLPCFAKFIFPSIGFDGWLSHCSESAAPHFRDLALGDLNVRDFWDLFYDYNSDKLIDLFNDNSKMMKELNCKCDRKEHVVNERIAKNSVFREIIA